MSDPLSKPVYQRILEIARQIPQGQVATYGQIAWIEGHCTPRMVGYAMAGLPEGSDVPWQRVINSQGKISPRGNMSSTIEQRLLLEDEGIIFRRGRKRRSQPFRLARPRPRVAVRKWVWRGRTLPTHAKEKKMSENTVHIDVWSDFN